MHFDADCQVDLKSQNTKLVMKLLLLTVKLSVKLRNIKVNSLLEFSKSFYTYYLDCYTVVFNVHSCYVAQLPINNTRKGLQETTKDS